MSTRRLPRHCRRKVRYGHRETAETAIKVLSQKWDDAHLSWYKCEYCDGYHIGHGGSYIVDVLNRLSRRGSRS